MPPLQRLVVDLPEQLEAMVDAEGAGRDARARRPDVPPPTTRRTNCSGRCGNASTICITPLYGSNRPTVKATTPGHRNRIGGDPGLQLDPVRDHDDAIVGKAERPPHELGLRLGHADDGGGPAHDARAERPVEPVQEAARAACGPSRGNAA